jgi:hypothetical protein
MPVNPGEFRFAGVDGRGSQQLVHDPRNGGSAVVRIEDRDTGSEGYTFGIFWGGVVAAAIVPVRIGADLRLNRIVAASDLRLSRIGAVSDLRLSRIAALTACLLATIIVTAVLVRIAVSSPIRPFEPARIGSKTKLAGVWELPVSISGAPSWTITPDATIGYSGISLCRAAAAARIFTASRAQSTLTPAACGRRTSAPRTRPTGNTHVMMLACNSGLRLS